MQTCEHTLFLLLFTTLYDVMLSNKILHDECSTWLYQLTCVNSKKSLHLSCPTPKIGVGHLLPSSCQGGWGLWCRLSFSLPSQSEENNNIFPFSPSSSSSSSNLPWPVQIHILNDGQFKFSYYPLLIASGKHSINDINSSSIFATINEKACNNM